MRRVLSALLAGLVTLNAPVPAMAQAAAQGRWTVGTRQNDLYDRGYRDGLRDGERDGRSGRTFDYDNDRRLSRTPDPFQRGYADGYRAGYERYRGQGRARRGAGPSYGRGRGGYEDPAFARGYADGFEKGIDDGRDRDRYDPVRHRDYRNADDGYHREYGSKQTYENNYRAGFRQGYEEGYRGRGRSRR